MYVFIVSVIDNHGDQEVIGAFRGPMAARQFAWDRAHGDMDDAVLYEVVSCRLSDHSDHSGESIYIGRIVDRYRLGEEWEWQEASR